MCVETEISEIYILHFDVKEIFLDTRQSKILNA